MTLWGIANAISCRPSVSCRPCSCSDWKSDTDKLLIEPRAQRDGAWQDGEHLVELAAIYDAGEDALRKGRRKKEGACDEVYFGSNFWGRPQHADDNAQIQRKVPTAPPSLDEKQAELRIMAVSMDEEVWPHTRWCESRAALRSEEERERDFPNGVDTPTYINAMMDNTLETISAREAAYTDRSTNDRPDSWRERMDQKTYNTWDINADTDAVDTGASSDELMDQVVTDSSREPTNSSREPTVHEEETHEIDKASDRSAIEVASSNEGTSFFIAPYPLSPSVQTPKFAASEHGLWQSSPVSQQSPLRPSILAADQSWMSCSAERLPSPWKLSERGDSLLETASVAAERELEENNARIWVNHFLKHHGYAGVNSKRTRPSMHFPLLRSKYALHTAVKQNSSHVVSLLLWAGANAKLKDSFGSTPLQLAEKNNVDGSHDAVIAALGGFTIRSIDLACMA